MDTEEMAERIARLCPAPGKYPMPLPRLTVMRMDQPTEPGRVLYQPFVGFVAQGAKTVMLENQRFRYAAGEYLACAVDLPVVGGVSEASAQAPYLAIALALDAAALATTLLEIEDTGPPATEEVGPGIGVSPTDADLRDALGRLLRLLGRPRDLAVLGPMIERELIYRLVNGPRGELLRGIARRDSRLHRIGRVIGWLRENFDQPLRIEDMAKIAGMSASSLHRHFRAVTALSPLQYQKRLRLLEARRRMLSEPGGAAGAAFAVGYDSASQFNREYARLFGAPPGRDRARLRAAPAAEDV